MKRYTEEEAIQKGCDPAVVVAYGNIDYLHIFAAQHHHEIKQGYPISVDERIHRLDARMEVPPLLTTMTFIAEARPDRRIKPKFLDIMGISPVTRESELGENGFFKGASTLVSESARDKLAPFLKEECVFVPTTVEGAPQPYYILWVRKIFDALDEERTQIKPGSIFGPPKKRVFRGKFHLDKIDATFLFRVPQWKYEQMDHDFALKPFRDLVKQLKIKGFEFAVGGFDGPRLK